MKQEDVSVSWTETQLLWNKGKKLYEQQRDQLATLTERFGVASRSLLGLLGKLGNLLRLTPSSMWKTLPSSKSRQGPSCIIRWKLSKISLLLVVTDENP